MTVDSHAEDKVLSFSDKSDDMDKTTQSFWLKIDKEKL